MIALIVPKDNHSIVFGSWRGESFSDNTRYLAEYIGEHYPEYRLYWVGKKKIREDVNQSPAKLHFLEMGKIKSNVKIMRCKYCFVSQKYHVDIFKYNILHNTVLCYLHHGTPVKQWGDDGLNKRKAVSRIEKLHDSFIGRSVNYTFYASSSPLNSKILCTAMKSCGCTMEKIIPSGTPRNDMLINYDPKRTSQLKQLYLERFGIDITKKVIMYLPTYRRLDGDMFSFFDLNTEDTRKINKLLEENNAVLIEKSHFAGKEPSNQERNQNLYFATKNSNVQEMLLFTDILISDYSGAFFDFSLLDRPIIHYAYDYETYRDVDSGLYFELNEFNAGAICREFDELCTALSDELAGKDSFSLRRKEIRNKYMEYEQGTASEMIFNTVVKNYKVRRQK